MPPPASPTDSSAGLLLRLAHPAAPAVRAPRSSACSSAGTADTAIRAIDRPLSTRRRSTRPDLTGSRPEILIHPPARDHPAGLDLAAWRQVQSPRPGPQRTATNPAEFFDSATARQEGGRISHVHRIESHVRPRPSGRPDRSCPGRGWDYAWPSWPAMSPTTCWGPRGSTHARGRPGPAPETKFGTGGERGRPRPSHDDRAIGVEVQAGQDRDRAGAVGPDRRPRSAWWA